MKKVDMAIKDRADKEEKKNEFKKKMIEDDNLVVKLTDEGKKVADYITEKIMY